MGLPLFKEPSDSDSSSSPKPGRRSPASPAHARSPIRRAARLSELEQTRQLERTRQQRLALTAALRSHISGTSPPSTELTQSLPPPPQWPGNRPATHQANDSPNSTVIGYYSNGRAMLGEEAESFRVRVAEGDLAELRTRAMQPSGTSSGETMDLDSFLEAGGDVLSEETTRDERPESVRSSSESFPTYSMLSVRHPWFASEEDRPRPNHNRTPPITGRPPAIGSSSRTHDQAIIEQIRERARNSLRERARNSFGLPAADRTRELEHLHNRRRANNGHLGRRTSYVDGYGARRLVDGLGDRERSLSPEGDNVWYTLQSTLTPDPQPPSVGSSFASTSVSAATSQSAPMDSSSNTTSNTAATSPEAVEPPCDPVNENSAVDDEESQSHLDSTSDHQHQRSQQLSRPQNRSSPARRSYAQVASQRGSSDAQEPDATMAENEAWRSGLMEGLTAPPGMPNSWWTQFGLSRRDSISHQPTLRSIFTHEDGNISRVVRNLAARQDIPDSWWARYGIERQTARDQQH